MPRFLHVSDTHLGKSVYDSDARRTDFTDAFVQAVDLAIDEAVDAVVHTGDLTDSSDWDETLPEAVEGALDALRDADIPFFFVLGNHDTTESGRPQAWVGELESSGRGTRLSTDAHDVETVALYGVDYHDADWWRTHDPEFEPAIGNPPALLCLHQAVSPFAPPGAGELDLATFLEEAAVSFDAVLLGHKHATLEREVDGTLATYAGTTERLSRAERDNEPKVNLLTVTDEEVTRSERSLDARPFAERTIVTGPGVEGDRVESELCTSLPERSVLTLHLVAPGDGLSTSDVHDAVTGLNPLDVDVRRPAIESDTEPGIYSCRPAALSETAPERRLAPPTTTDDSSASALTPEDGQTGTDADYATPFEAYVAGLEGRDGVCDFVFEPARWARHFEVDAQRDYWACPRATDEGCCVFHTPLSARQADPGETVDRFCAEIEGAGRNEFVGARFESLDLSHRQLDAPDRYPIDLSHARIRENVDLSKAVVPNHLRLDGASTHRLRAVEATFESAFDARGLELEGTAEFADAHFDRGATFTGAAFQTAGFDGCVFDDDATFDDAVFDFDVRFERTTFAGRARFDDADFSGEATFEHATFAEETKFHDTGFEDDVEFSSTAFHGGLECFDATFAEKAHFEEAAFHGRANFKRSTFSGRANFFAVRADTFLGFYDATFEGSVSFYGATVAPVTHFRRTTFEEAATFTSTTFGTTETNFRDARFEAETTFERAHFQGPVVFDENVDDRNDYEPAAFEADATFTRATFREDVDFVGVSFDGLTRFDRTTWHSKAEFGLAPDSATENGAARFRGRVVFDRAKFLDDLNFTGVTFEALLSGADLQSRGVVDLSETTILAGATFTDSEFRTLRLDDVSAPGLDPVVTLARADIPRGSVVQPTDDAPLLDLTRARLGTVDVVGDPNAGPAFDTLFVNQTEFDGFEFTSVADDVPDSWELHRVSDEYSDVVRPSLTAQQREATYRSAKNGADAVSDSTASSNLFRHEMQCRREGYREAAASTDSIPGSLVSWGRYARNWGLGLTTGYGEQTTRVVATGLTCIAVVFPLLYGVLDWLRPDELVGHYSTPNGYLQLSAESFVALVLGRTAAVAGPVAHFLVYTEALVGALVVAMLVLTLTRSVYR